MRGNRPGDLVIWNLASLCRLLVPLGRGRWICWQAKGPGAKGGLCVPRPRRMTCGTPGFGPVRTFPEKITRNITACCGVRTVRGLGVMLDRAAETADKARAEGGAHV